MLSPEDWEVGTIVFLKLPDVQLGGFAEVRHCTRRKDGRYAVGLKFNGPLIPQGSEWQIQRVCQPTQGWTRSDDVPNPQEAPLPPRSSEVA